MADQSDVEAALAAVIGGALYPAGISAGCVVPGAIVRVYRGWPVSAGLDADLAAGRSNVSILADGSAENTTRWPDAELTAAPVAAALLANVVGDTVTLSGAAALGQVVAVIADGRNAAYRTRVDDTPARVAGMLARAFGVVANGTAFSVAGVRSPVVRVEADQPVLRMTRRQLQRFKVTCWCADPIARDALGSAIDSALSAIEFIGLSDGTSGRLRAVASNVSDRWQDAALYRRELIYSVDYATTVRTALPRMAIGISDFGPNGLTVTRRLS